MAMSVGLKGLAHKLLMPSAIKRKWSPEVLQDRIERWCTVCFKLLYFVCATAFGFYVLLDAPWMPSSLGGRGTKASVFEDYPFSKPTPLLSEYYLIELAYHVQSLLFHVGTPHRSDYSEMMLHHLCAICLMLFSYFENFIRVGSLVLIVHDIADIAGYCIKASVDTVYTKITLSFFISLLFFWAYTRFYVYPFYVIDSIHIAFSALSANDALFPWVFLTTMLYILLVLHVYWYALFLYSGYSYLVTGVTTDHQQTTIEAKLKKNASASELKKEKEQEESESVSASRGGEKND